MIAPKMINFIATFLFFTLQKAAETINPTITYIRHISAINHSLIVIAFRLIMFVLLPAPGRRCQVYD